MGQAAFVKRFWDWLTKSRYTRHLEDEMERLRGENRKLMDAILVAKGLPPLTTREPKPLPHTSGRVLPSQFIRKRERQSQPIEEKAS